MPKKATIPTMRKPNLDPLFSVNTSDTNGNQVNQDKQETELSLSIIRIPNPEERNNGNHYWVQPRFHFDDDRQKQLTESIKADGLQQAVLVRPIKDTQAQRTGFYELVYGQRRYHAHEALGIETIRCRIEDLSDLQAKRVALAENLCRQDLNDYEETEGILQLIELQLDCDRATVRSILAQNATARKNKTELSANVCRQLETIESITENFLGITPDSFRRTRLPLLELPEELKLALHQSQIDASNAREIAKIKDKSQRKQLLDETIELNLPVSEVKKRVKELNAPIVNSEKEQSVLKLVERFTHISRSAKQKLSGLPQDKQEKATELLNQLEELFEEN